MLADQDEAAATLLDGLDLDALLGALVRTRGYEAALRDPPGKRAWSDELPTSISFVHLYERIDQLAGLLHMNRAQPGARVAILAPLGPEAIISTLASLRAGLSPLLLPLHAGDADLLRMIDEAGAVMGLGVGRVGAVQPLTTLRRLAARAFGMRFVGGFGQVVPDGVAPLDALMASAARHPLPALASRSPLHIVEPRGLDGPHAVSERAILAGALAVSRLLKPMASSRIVSALSGCDLASLATGPGAALLTGAELLPLGLFSHGDLQACLEGGRTVHLVAPAALESALARSRLGGHDALASVVFVHRPGDAPALPALDRPELTIVDLHAGSATGIEVARR